MNENTSANRASEENISTKNSDATTANNLEAKSNSSTAPELPIQFNAPAETVDAADAPISFFSLTLEDLQDHLQKFGKEKFRAQQLFKWVYEKRVTDPEQMSNLSKTFREDIKTLFDFSLPKVVSHLKSVDGTQKFLLDMGHGMTVEAVLIPSDDRLTLCVSSEVGCNMACKFCFTGKQKLKKRLSAGQIVGQFMQAHDSLKAQWREVAKDLPPSRWEDDGPRISNIVFMGMGEPLDNSDAVFKSIEVLHSPWGMNFSRRKVTVSTSGIVPEMHKIADARVRMAVSLNGSNDEVRSKVMPINNRWPLKELLAECRRYTRATKDRITFEYVLLKGVTDSIEQAREVYQMTKDIPSKINIIPFNEHPSSGFERPSDETVEKFHAELMRLGAHVLLRRTMGRDIFAACGQLNSTFENRPETMDISNSKLGGRHAKPTIQTSRSGESRLR
ncbi:MAG: 23S rRNA (adenine(2503)-C(2))-methyltransferase RlmN [Bdellovibrionota bacterium]